MCCTNYFQISWFLGSRNPALKKFIFMEKFPNENKKYFGGKKNFNQICLQKNWLVVKSLSSEKLVLKIIQISICFFAKFVRFTTSSLSFL